jgi:hypothetical protein
MPQRPNYHNDADENEKKEPRHCGLDAAPHNLIQCTMYLLQQIFGDRFVEKAKLAQNGLALDW